MLTTYGDFQVYTYCDGLDWCSQVSYPGGCYHDIEKFDITIHQAHIKAVSHLMAGPLMNNKELVKNGVFIRRPIGA